MTKKEIEDYLSFQAAETEAYLKSEEFYRIKFELEQLDKQSKRRRNQKLVGIAFMVAVSVAFHFGRVELGQFIAYFGLIILPDVK